MDIVQKNISFDGWMPNVTQHCSIPIGCRIHRSCKALTDINKAVRVFGVALVVPEHGRLASARASARSSLPSPREPSIDHHGPKRTKMKRQRRQQPSVRLFHRYDCLITHSTALIKRRICK